MNTIKVAAVQMDLVQCWDENDFLNVYYFSRFYKEQSKQRIEFVRSIVPQLMNRYC